MHRQQQYSVASCLKRALVVITPPPMMAGHQHIRYDT
jgi:hypothetical protein